MPFRRTPRSRNRSDWFPSRERRPNHGLYGHLAGGGGGRLRIWVFQALPPHQRKRPPFLRRFPLLLSSGALSGLQPIVV
ncbi:uncharacterized protein CLUP02_11130 [Colletotrichum lupini]|uniref:Uncharacterized protein n=1 Tax=Colletotrichum lupini TaxID=145971 RepID=A0A9Q8SZP4_9PEZI|nr:uncharacterized protein CLUP02_11130 [Colletotrichum lupini]UQC85631.1 hypothetical protein CLUP02_11130 [Colletotrichum lupini]